MDAILAQASSQTPLLSTLALQRQRMCLFASFSKLHWHQRKSCLFVTQLLLLLLLPISVPASPDPELHPQGWRS